MAKSHFNEHEMSHFRQHCNLQVPSLMISDDKMTPDMYSESQASYRFVYELVLPYLLPIFILGKYIILNINRLNFHAKINIDY